MEKNMTKNTNNPRHYWLGIDVGGTSVKLALYCSSHGMAAAAEDGSPAGSDSAKAGAVTGNASPAGSDFLRSASPAGGGLRRPQLLCRTSIPTRIENAGELILPDISDAAQRLVSSAGLSLADIRGAGIGVPGPVLEKTEDGYPVVGCVNLNWTGIRFIDTELRELTGIENIYVCNDANAAALGELFFGEDPADAEALEAGSAVGSRPGSDPAEPQASAAASGFMTAEVSQAGTNPADAEAPQAEADPVGPRADSDPTAGSPAAAETSDAGDSDLHESPLPDSSDAVMVTLGTGVGGGIIHEGRIITGAFGAGGEIGHMPVRVGGEFLEHIHSSNPACTLRRQADLEYYASATGIARIAAAALQAVEMDPDSWPSEISSPLRELEGPDAKAIFDAAKAGDPLALSIAETFCDILGQGLASIASVVDPDLFIIGGGVSAAGDFLLDGVRESYRRQVFHASRGTAFRLARLGNDAGLMGPLVPLMLAED